MDHLVHYIFLWFIFVVFQNISTSSFYIRASPQIFLDAYPTIVRVLCTVPTLAHQTAAALVLHFWIFIEIHPPLIIHHMLEAPLPLLLCNTMIWSSCCSLVLLLRAADSAIALSLHLNSKWKSFGTPMKSFHLQLDSPNPHLVQLSYRCSQDCHHYHHCAPIQCIAFLRLGPVVLLCIVTFSQRSFCASSDLWLHSYR